MTMAGAYRWQRGRLLPQFEPDDPLGEAMEADDHDKREPFGAGVTTTNSMSVAMATEANNDRYREACRRLADRTAAIRERLVTELAHAQREHEIDWRGLLSSQREIAEKAATGTAPGAQVFWLHQAEPRADELRSACESIIDAHLLLLWDAVSVFSDSARSLPGTDTNDDIDLADLRTDVERLVRPISDVRLDRTALDDVGERWSQRMRRQAIRRYVRSGGHDDPSFASAIDEQELRMMGQAPWAQADQLLSAFELAHADVRRSVTGKVDRMLTDLLTG